MANVRINDETDVKRGEIEMIKKKSQLSLFDHLLWELIGGKEFTVEAGGIELRVGLSFEKVPMSVVLVVVVIEVVLKKLHLLPNQSLFNLDADINGETITSQLPSIKLCCNICVGTFVKTANTRMQMGHKKCKKAK